MLEEESGIREIIENESGFVDANIIIPESGFPESGLTKEAKTKIKKSIEDMIKEASSESGALSTTEKQHEVKVYSPEESKKILKKDEITIINEILKAKTTEELQNQFKIFNLNQSKRNALRISRLNILQDKIEEQALNRFTKNPNAIGNKEVLEYLTVISEQINKAQGSIDKSAEESKPAIQINQQKIENKINLASDLDRDSKERVVSAISALLKKVKDDKFLKIENKTENEEEKTVSNNNDTKEDVIEVDTTKEK